MSLHPIMSQALAPWMHKPAPSCTIDSPEVAEAKNHLASELLRSVADIKVPTMAEQLREEYASGLDAVPPGRDWEPEQ